MQPRKVLHVIPSVSPLRGGPSIMLRRLAEGLSTQGVETHVATTNDNGPGTLGVPLGDPVLEGQVTYHYFARQTRFYTFSWPLSTWLSGHVADYDVVHIHALFSWASIPAAFWAYRRHVPYVLRPLGTLNRWGIQNRRPTLKKWSLRLIESRILRRAAAVQYTSAAEQVEAESLGIRTGTPAVIPNPVASAGSGVPSGGFRDSCPEALSRPIVLFLSRLDEKKGIDILLRAFQGVRARRPSALLVIAGNGPAAFVARMKQLATDLGVSADVLWLGFVDGAEKGALLADADLFVLPSYSENFGIAAAEAMAAGLPIVVSDQVAIHTEVAGAGAGVIVPCEPAPVASAICRLLDDPALRTAMGRHGQALAAERYSTTAVARQVVALYAGIINRNDEPSHVPSAGAAPQDDSARI